MCIDNIVQGATGQMTVRCANCGEAVLFVRGRIDCSSGENSLCQSGGGAGLPQAACGVAVCADPAYSTNYDAPEGCCCKGGCCNGGCRKGCGSANCHSAEAPVNAPVDYQPDIYNKDWFNWQHSGAFMSAGVMLSYFFSRLMEPRSVVDVGCGTGVWLKAAELLGVERIFGMDGCQHEMTFLPSESYIQADFEKCIPALAERFDLAVCLEVAEHLSEACAGNLVQRLCSYSDCILFSAAYPGQGGDGHINEQPITYWMDLFARQGYAIADVIRPGLNGVPCVESWYYENTFVFYRRGNERLQKLFSQYNTAFIVARGNGSDNPYWNEKKDLIINLSYEIYNSCFGGDVQTAGAKMSVLKSLIKNL